MIINFIDKLKAKKALKFLKKNKFSFLNIPADIKNLLLDDKIREIVNLNISDENKIYLRKNLYFAYIAEIKDKVEDYSNKEIIIKTKAKNIVILNYIKKDSRDDIHYECLRLNTNILQRDYFEHYKVGDLFISEATPLATKLNDKGNSYELFSKKEILIIEEALTKENNKKPTENNEDDGLLFH